MVVLAAHHDGIVYIRTTRPKTPALYSNTEEFALGGLKVLRQSGNDRALIVATGALARAASEAGGVVVTVEDHYAAGGLGDAVASALGPEGVRVHRLAVREVPRSGRPEELLAWARIDADAIVETVRALVKLA